MAAQRNLPDILVALISAGMEVDGRDIAGRTPLHYASSQGHVKVCRVLLQNQANINAADKDYNTPLAFAAQMGRVEVVNLFLATAGIDVNFQTRLGYTPLMSAIRYENESDAYKLLIAHPDVKLDLVNKLEETALHVAVQVVFVEGVEALLPECAEIINLVDHAGYQALHIATEINDEDDATDIVKLLLACEVIDAGQQNKNFETPLHIAAGKGYSQICRLLAVRIDSGMLKRDKKGRTPLGVAAEKGFGETAQLLQERMKKFFAEADTGSDSDEVEL